jgi:hypothetical protein
MLSLTRPAGIHTDLLPNLAGALELYRPIYQGEQRVIPAGADIPPWADRRATLPNQDRAGQNGLAVATLDPKPLPWGVTPISRAPHTFLMSHLC